MNPENDPENIYKHAKNVSKKYSGKSAITGKWLQTSQTTKTRDIIFLSR